MAAPFLTARWQNLLMLNFQCDPAILTPLLPHGTELDLWQGKHLVSMVGFLFADTQLRGIRIPLHVRFEEVNLRFYVRRKGPDGWRRGTVFVKEIVPKPCVTFIANTLYGEHYATHPMRYTWEYQRDGYHIGYEWKVGNQWNFLRAVAHPTSSPLLPGSEEEFITEHYWGYTRLNALRTGAYEVQHPRWNIHAIQSFDFQIDTAKLYGEGFTESLAQPPQSVFLADGSAIAIMPGTKL